MRETMRNILFFAFLFLRASSSSDEEAAFAEGVVLEGHARTKRWGSSKDTSKSSREYDDDYIEIRHDDGGFAGMRAVPITSGLTMHFTNLQDDDDVENKDSLADDVVMEDDFDGGDEEVIHVIRRQPQIAKEVIEFDPVDGRVRKGILHHKSDQSLGSKIASYFHDRHLAKDKHQANDRHFHENGHLAFDAVSEDISKYDVNKIKEAIKQKRRRDKELSKRLKEYEKRLTSSNALRRKTSKAAAKQLTKLLTTEDKEARRRKDQLVGEEERVRAEEERAERLADSALTERDVKDIVDSIHETHLNMDRDGVSVKRSTELPRALDIDEKQRLKEEGKVADQLRQDIVDSIHETHLNTDRDGVSAKRSTKLPRALYIDEKQRLKEEGKVADQLRQAIDSSLDLPQRHFDPPSPSQHLQHRREQLHLQHREYQQQPSTDFLEHLSSLAKDSEKRRMSNVNDGAMEELISEFDRWKHLKGIPPSNERSRAKELKALTAEYAKWKQRRQDGGGGGAKKQKNRGKNAEDGLLKASLQDFERWKILRAAEAEALRTREG